ncbi:hypothetical protein ABDK96_06260 [Citricoccus nitrophenolicus]|uniref:Uncharacterized protein n=1 Tax=Citricoccus nitrophenolicus TaxID=863575 RepID=A0ABV0IGJ1_9MICC|nr:hypothetical protein [Citricoccus sp. I39-566]WMY79223.1 hypothetical protein RE421_04995 [Citricoccus sp. I39-566]
MDHVNPEVPEEDRLEQSEAVTAEEAEDPVAAAAAAAHRHDDERAAEWEDESFPASDPPSNY